MPLYTYVCVDCAKQQEQFVGMNDPNPPCKYCGKKLDKIITGTRIWTQGAAVPLGKRLT